MVDDLAERLCSPFLKEPLSRGDVVRKVLVELYAPEAKEARYRYDKERWGIDAESSRADEGALDIPTFNDPGDGAV